MTVLRERVTKRTWQAKAGAVALVGLVLTGCGTQAKNDTFSLSAMPAIEGPASTRRQILVPEPTAIKAIDSENIVVRLKGSELQYLAQSQWSDRLPRLVQAKLVQAFENTGKVGGVGKPGEGLAIDYQVVTEIRTFEINTVGGSHATVEIFAKILNDRNGTVRTQKAFRATVPIRGSDHAGMVAALDGAFAKVAADLVAWTLVSI
ncbi:ABC transporter [Rhizobium rhizosphaerae]|uniref:ABC transporter n=1 Tax=Xaviernesmea rhizosphaerae TaxID=1672749 RepID=A0A1Q9AN07_9HYPH|nr:ABC-type transport auxiliary lipoprotein family protein [Xaviernesmea rhizosphaerae]OLP56743.1 ABC transporter [Xaviernesmea rhizosphaerae]